MTIKVGIVGFGTIGKRVADAVNLQQDMKVIGITAKSYNYRIMNAAKQGMPVFTVEGADELPGISVQGDIKDLCKEADIILDCAPKPMGKENKGNYYVPNKVKAVFQGGEKANVGQCSFTAQCNYKESVNKDYVRVVSCNTTGLSRSLKALDDAFGVDFVRATLVRRGTDPGEIKKGPINAIVPAMELPSHHGPDVRTVLPDMEVFTTAIIVPTTIMHMHTLSVVLKRGMNGITVDDVLKTFKDQARIRVVSSKEGIHSTAQICELARDLGHKRGDMMDLCVWKEGMGLHHGELFFMQAVHQESIVVPETVDCIRAMMGEEDAEKSMLLTNKSLGMKH
ncbi:MAG: type II glyceraldehyde-3-phosphate dehydrogenase [Nanoarchaeota archaeon]